MEKHRKKGEKNHWNEAEKHRDEAENARILEKEAAALFLHGGSELFPNHKEK